MDAKKLIDKAYEAFPFSPDGSFDGEPMDGNSDCRYGFHKGYEMAEKDLALTWEDIDLIIGLWDQVRNDFCDDPKSLKIEGEVNSENIRKAFFNDVLRRYNEKKNEK